MNNYTKNQRIIVGYRFFLFNSIFSQFGLFVVQDVFFIAFKNSGSHDFVNFATIFPSLLITCHKI